MRSIPARLRRNPTHSFNGRQQVCQPSQIIRNACAPNAGIIQRNVVASLSVCEYLSVDSFVTTTGVGPLLRVVQRCYMAAVAVLLVLNVGVPCAMSQDSVMTPETLWQLGRLGEATVAPDGRIAYTVRRYNLAKNSGTTSIEVFDPKSQSTNTVVESWPSVNSLQFAKSNGHQTLYFIGSPASQKSDAGAPQVFALVDGDREPHRVTDVADGVANLKVSPTGDRMAFTVDIKMDPTANEVYPDLPLADARIIDNLLYRHWDSWHDFKYSHVHVADLHADGTSSTPIDLMKGMRTDCPLPPFGGSEQFAWSPDGKQIALTIKDVKDEAESTNSDVYLVATDGSSPPRNITSGNPGYDNDPVYSPDGKTLAYHSMRRASFESDRNRIMLFDRQTESVTEATEGLDQMAHSGTWSVDSRDLLVIRNEGHRSNLPHHRRTSRCGTRHRRSFQLVDGRRDARRETFVAQERKYDSTCRVGRRRCRKRRRNDDLAHQRRNPGVPVAAHGPGAVGDRNRRQEDPVLGDLSSKL